MADPMNDDRAGKFDASLEETDRMIPPKDLLERNAIYLLRETGAACSLGVCHLETPAEGLCMWCKRLLAENLNALREAYAAGIEAAAKVAEQIYRNDKHARTQAAPKIRALIRSDK